MKSSVFLIAATISVFVEVLVLLLRRKQYGVTALNSVVSLVFSSVVLVLMTQFLGNFLGHIGFRYYIMALLLPLLFVILSVFLKMDYGEISGFYSPIIAIADGITKFRCVIEGCCYGIILFQTKGGTIVRFPSQIFEILLALFVFIIIMKFEKKQCPHNLLYPLTMIYYGFVRYIADWLRGDPHELRPYVLWLPAGRFYSVLIIIIGSIMLYVALKKNLSKKPSITEYFGTVIGKMPFNKQEI